MTIDEVFVPHVGWLTCPAEDDVLRFLREGWFEYREQAFWWLYLRDGDSVIDCGAHVGLYSVLAGKACGRRGRVIAIEPHPETAALLRQNLEANEIGHGVILQCALSDAVGSADFYLRGATKAAYSSLRPDAAGAPSIQVPATTIDALCRKKDIRHIDLLKIDAEGAEISILRGAQQSIQSGILPLAVIEFAEHNLRAFGLNTEELFKFLESLGYQLCRFDEAQAVLVKQAYQGAIWYDNLFATTNRDLVNEKLATASPKRKRIAREIIRRGKAAAQLRSEEWLKRLDDALTRADASQRTLEQTVNLLDDAHRRIGEAGWRADEANRRAEEASKSLDEAYKRTGEANWRADEANRRAEEALKSLDEAYKRAGEANWRADEANRRADEALKSLDEAYKRTGEANWRADEANRRAENLAAMLDESYRKLGEANWRANEFNERLKELLGRLGEADRTSRRALDLEAAARQELAGERERAALLEARLRDAQSLLHSLMAAHEQMAQSRYVRAVWRLGLAPRPNLDALKQFTQVVGEVLDRFSSNPDQA